MRGLETVYAASEDPSYFFCSGDECWNNVQTFGELCGKCEHDERRAKSRVKIERSRSPKGAQSRFAGSGSREGRDKRKTRVELDTVLNWARETSVRNSDKFTAIHVLLTEVEQFELKQS